jgi:succinate dehydrogenase/fumarate reductase flavoprotein subunit
MARFPFGRDHHRDARCPCTLQDVMQQHAAVFREDATLKEGCTKIAEVYDTLKDIKVFDHGKVPLASNDWILLPSSCLDIT